MHANNRYLAKAWATPTPLFMAVGRGSSACAYRWSF